MKLIYAFSEGFPSTDTQCIQAVRTCYGLASNGCRVEMLIGKASGGRLAEILPFYGLQENPNLTIHRLPILRNEISKILPFSWNGFFHLICLAAIMYLNRDKTYQAIYLRHPKLAIFLITFRNLHNLPVIYEAHELFHLNEDLSDINRANRLRTMEARIFGNADVIVSITENLQKAIVKDFGPNTSVWVIPDGTDIPASVCLPKSQLKQNIICYAGQLYPWKGLDTLLMAMSLIDKASLEIIGGEPADINRLKILAKEQGVLEKVRFRGKIKPAEVFQNLCQASVAVLPATSRLISSRFTSPLKLFEYMACRIPIVAANVPSYREVLVHGRNALLVKPEDAVDLAFGIRSLLNDQELAKRIAGQAFLDVQEFTWAKRGQRIIEVVESLH